MKLAVERKRRRVLLSSRQVGIVAAFGGLGFAYIALGLYIPLAGPWIVDLREPLTVLTGMVGGPWVGLMTGFLCIVGSPWPMGEAPYYMVLGFLTGVVSKKIWALSGWRRWVTLIICLFVFEYLVFLWPAWWWNTFLGYPFMVLIYTGYFGALPIYIVTEVIVIALGYRFAPEFMEPRWLWIGGESVRKPTAK